MPADDRFYLKEFECWTIINKTLKHKIDFGFQHIFRTDYIFIYDN